MLKGIHPCVSPDLLKILTATGHGDEILLAAARFPSHTFAPPRIACRWIVPPHAVAQYPAAV